MTFLCTGLLVSAVIGINGCSTAKQVSQAYNLTQCTYSYNSVSALSVAGIDAMKSPSLGTVAQIGNLLTGGLSSVPVNMTVNLDVKNPNQSAAAMSGLQYILSIDDIEFTRGEVSQNFEVAAGDSAVLPLAIVFDLAQMLKSDSADAVVGIAKNLLGVGSQKTKITLQLKPSVKVAGYTVPSPVYIPVSFEFGGKK